MPRGRPKGIKNGMSSKAKESLSTNAPMIGVTEIKKDKKERLPTHPDWVLTKTSNNTPIAIEKILKRGSDYEFLVTPNYKIRTQKTTVKSTSVVKPEFPTPEIEKGFDGITWYVPPPQSPTLNEEIVSPEILPE